MDPSTFYTEEYDKDMRALESLLHVFGSVCSLEDIASAYCKAGLDVIKAADMLHKFQQHDHNDTFNANDSVMTSAQQEELLHEINTVKSSIVRQVPRGSKPKKLSASVGTVSSVLGKSYGRPVSSTKGFSEPNKPLKLKVEKSWIDELETEPVVSGAGTRKDSLRDSNVEEFLFSMLGDGFKLSMDVIREVLDQCGYDLKKSVEELLALSAKSLDKGKAIDDGTMEKFTDKRPETGLSASEEGYLAHSLENSVESTLDKDKSNLPREVIEALFNAPDISDGEETERNHIEPVLNRTRLVGQKVVTEPLDDVDLAPIDIDTILPVIKDDAGDVGDEYQVMRKTVKMHWDTMKTYYEAAVESFNKGDQGVANYFMEQGKHYNQMAREADEKSVEQFIDPRENDIEADVKLDLHDHSSKEAIYMLKLHLQSLANIPSIVYLKVIVNTGAEDAKKRKRKRLVSKFLERESIKWTEEEGNPGTIFIRMDVIDPNKLSFVEGP